MARATKPTWPRWIVLVLAAAFLLLACEEAIGPPGPPVDLPPETELEPPRIEPPSEPEPTLPDDPPPPEEPPPPPDEPPEEPPQDPQPDPPPEPEPPLTWVPDHVIEVSVWKTPERPWCWGCDPETDYAGREVSDQEWLEIVRITNEIFQRSAIRVSILTEKTPGVVDIEVTFWKGWPGGEAGIAWAERSYEEDRPELLCTELCFISYYMGWQGSEPGYGWDFELWLPKAAQTLAHELVHIVGRLEWDQCGHRLGDGTYTAHLPRYWYDHELNRLSDYVRENCFAGLPPWVTPERYH